MEMSKNYQEITDYLKENAHIISQKVFEVMKNNHLNNKALSIELHCDENTISRKKNNKNGAYYNIDDLNILSNIFNCRVEYLACIDNFRTNDEIIDIDKRKLRKDYEKAIDYLGSIGILLQPGIFWYGTKDQFENAKDKIWPFLTDKSQTDYKRKKRVYYDKLPESEHFYFRLKDNPKKEMPNIEEIETKNISATNLDSAFVCEDLSNKSINKFSGVICLRFSLSFENSDTAPMTISVDEANKLFAYMDKTIRDNVKTLIDCNILKSANSKDYYYSDDYLYTLQDLFVEYFEYKKQQEQSE